MPIARPEKIPYDEDMKTMFMYGLGCTGCGAPLIQVNDDDGQEAVLIYRSKPMAQIASTEQVDEEGKQPNVILMSIKYDIAGDDVDDSIL